MLEIEHILFDEGRFDFFVGPVDEESIVEVGFLCEAATEVDGILEVCPVPIGLEQDAQFLCSAEREHWDKHLATLVECVMYAA